MTILSAKQPWLWSLSRARAFDHGPLAQATRSGRANRPRDAENPVG